MAPEDADLYASAASRVIAIYQRRAHEDAPDENEGRQLRKADTVERKLRLAALQGERAEIIDLARRRRISDETSRKLIREIDLVESRYR